MGRGVEGLAKGFGSRRRSVLCQTPGLPAAFSEGTGLLLPALITVVTVGENCSGDDSSPTLWGMAWARPKGRRERWMVLEHILIRGNASLRILYF